MSKDLSNKPQPDQRLIGLYPTPDFDSLGNTTSQGLDNLVKASKATKTKEENMEGIEDKLESSLKNYSQSNSQEDKSDKDLSPSELSYKSVRLLAEHMLKNSKTWGEKEVALLLGIIPFTLDNRINSRLAFECIELSNLYLDESDNQEISFIEEMRIFVSKARQWDNLG